MTIDDPRRGNRARQLQFRLFDDEAAILGMHIHQGENCRRLHKTERNVKAIANMHVEFPEGLQAGMSGDASRLNSGSAASVPSPEPGPDARQCSPLASR